MLTSKEQEYVERIERRIRHLRNRLADAKGKGHNLSYDAAEVAALEWALRKALQ